VQGENVIGKEVVNSFSYDLHPPIINISKNLLFKYI